MRCRPDGSVEVRRTTVDDYRVAEVRVNGVKATPTDPNFAQWQIVLPATPSQVTASATEGAGFSYGVRCPLRVRKG